MVAFRAVEPEHEPRWTLAGVDLSPDAVMCPVGGPLDDRLPSAFTARLTQAEDQFAVTLRCRFQKGERIFVEAVTLEAMNGRSIAPLDLTTLQLAQAVERAAEAAVDPGHGAHLARRTGVKLDDDELQLVAGVYAFRVVAWGGPRRAVMGYWDLSRSTATRWIARARQRFPYLPEPPAGSPKSDIPDVSEIPGLIVGGDDDGGDRGERGASA